MIDWQNVFWNSLWIIGLALILSAVGLSRYKAIVQRRKFSQCWGETGIQITISIGSTLISASLAFFAERWWERTVWILFAVLFIGIILFENYRKLKNKPSL